MTYVGQIAHQLPDRVRIRVHAKRGDKAFFDRLVSELSAAPSVTGVRANPEASSVAISFDPRKGDIRTALEAAGLFEFREAAPARLQTKERTPARPLDHDEMLAVGLSGLGAIQLANGEAVGAASESFWNAYRARTHLGNNSATLALTVLGVVQVMRGQYLNSASALFFYALTAWQLAKERRAAERPAARPAAPAQLQPQLQLKQKPKPKPKPQARPSRRDKAERSPRAPAR